MKKIISLCVILVMMVSVVGCGAISNDAIVGDWTTKTINGKAISEYAKTLGVDPALLATNITIKDNGTIEFASSTEKKTYNYEKKSNGIEVKEVGKEAISFSMLYKESDKTISFGLEQNGTKLTFVIGKGTANLTPAATAATGEAQ